MKWKWELDKRFRKEDFLTLTLMLWPCRNKIHCTEAPFAHFSNGFNSFYFLPYVGLNILKCIADVRTSLLLLPCFPGSGPLSDCNEPSLMLPGLPGPLCILPYPRPGFRLFWSCPHSINVEVGRWCGPPLPGFVLDESQERNRQDKRDVGKSCCRLEAHASIWYEVICCRHGSITVYALFLPSSRRFHSVSPGFPLELCLCVFSIWKWSPLA